MIARVVFIIFLLISAFVLPWWFTFIFAISASFYFKNFYEVVFVGLVMDSFFGSQVIFADFSYILTITFFILILVINQIRQKLIMY